jgi:hypothetical protein
VNLDLQSNTWHNLTYAYQGEGGSKVTYLDGRKVAEDQAEDTFGEYPPFAMTGYSQGGYVVSVSNYQSGYEAWEIFDQYEGASGGQGWWMINTERYSTSGNYDYISGSTHNLGTSTGSSTSTDNGHWVKIEMPHKLKLSYVNMKSSQYHEQGPKDFKFYGSKNNKDWELIKSFTNATPLSGRDYTINSTVGYKAIGLVVTAINGHTGGQLGLSDMQLYGHRENDLVRLPDPTNVLKYPHVAMTGPAQRGYVAKVSSQTSTTVDYPHIIFDGDDTTQFRSTLNTYTSGTANTTDNLKTQTSAGGTATIDGSWISIELPHKLILQSTRVVSNDGTSHVPKRLIIYGSNDITNDGWVEVDTTYKSVDANIPYQGTGKTWTTTASSTGYKNFALAVSQIESTGNNRLVVSTWELYGTEEATPVPIQIGGGNIDKVANFRVYDKFIGEDQVNEIWNAQKEEFERAKPQMVLQQGKLGIGTDAPQGSLSVADEPHNLEEFPPRAMTADKTYIEGHGEFCTSVTEIYPNAYAYKAFNKIQSGSNLDFHWSANTGDYDNVTGVYTGSSDYFTNVEGQIALGHWIQIKFPYKINYRYSEIQGPDHAAGRQPHTGYIVGSNDLSDVWTSLHNYSGMTRTGVRDFVTYTPPTISTQSFKYFRLVIEKMGGGNTTAGVSQWHIFGTREQGQSVLHDGALTLTKSLNVPRIGPALDADDTPRRDRLVVEYNTSTNPTFEGAVRDTSGRGNDALLIGSSAVYDANEKCLTVTTADHDIQSVPLNNPGGAYVHSFSIWFKMITIDRVICQIGADSGGVTSGLYINNNNINHYFYGNDQNYVVNIGVGSWNHIVATYDGGSLGGSRRLWFNGNEITGSIGATTTAAAANIEANTTVHVASRKATTNRGSSVSNFKLYDTALTAQEAKTLYDMGRTGNVVNPQPLHISGPINVMGDIRYITSRPLALPTMWDHMANGNCAKGVYPIVGRNGGDTIYHVYCEPDWAGGGWMCMAQFAKNGYQVKAHPTNGDLNIFTKGLGDSKNIRWNNTFAVPLNILSLDGDGYDLDVMIVVLGGGYAGRYEGGMRVGSIWRGHQLSVAFNPGTSSYPGASGLASSSDGYSFSTRTPVTNQNYDMINSGGWFYSCAANENYQGSYNDQGLSDGGYILHQGSANKVGSIYGAYHSDTGVAYNSQGHTDFACVRIFVRPSVY